MSGDGSRQLRALSSLRSSEAYNFQSDYEQTSGSPTLVINSRLPLEEHWLRNKAHPNFFYMSENYIL